LLRVHFAQHQFSREPKDLYFHAPSHQTTNATVILSEASELLRAQFAQHQFSREPKDLHFHAPSHQTTKATVILSGARSAESKDLRFTTAQE
jgi:hypothetical protein